MIVKAKFTGKSMIKYSILFWLIKIILVAIFIYLVLMPFGEIFLDELTKQLNSQIWNMKVLFKPIGRIILYFLGFVLIEIFGTFVVIFPMAKRELD